MKLIDIDKSRYRQHLNTIIVGFIVVFTLLALVFGQTLIAFFSEIALDGSQVNNFRFNLTGVVLALLTCAAILAQLRHHAYFHEVYFVWQLKQLLNLIYRRLRIIKNKAQDNDVNALIILHYYYMASRKLYLLDDNTLTLSTITKDIEQLQKQTDTLNLTISSDDFDKSMLTLFKTKKR